MKGNHSSREGRQVGPPKMAASEVSSGEAKSLETRKRKKRLWVNPKDKSLGRKVFLKVRDAKARSQFSKLQKSGKAPESLVDSSIPIATADDNEAFLERLLDPFAKHDPEAFTSVTKPPPKKFETKRSGAMQKQGLESLKSKRDLFESGRKINSPQEADLESNSTETEEQKQLPSHERTPQAAEGSDQGKKGYMPFLKAQKAFEAKQREKEALRLARQAEAERELLRKKEKRMLNKIAHKKLQARTKKGQLVMGNVVDVLLLKMQKNKRQ